jgi:hypothetical protein
MPCVVSRNFSTRRWTLSFLSARQHQIAAVSRPVTRKAAGQTWSGVARTHLGEGVEEFGNVGHDASLIWRRDLGEVADV